MYPRNQLTKFALVTALSLTAFGCQNTALPFKQQAASMVEYINQDIPFIYVPEASNILANMMVQANLKTGMRSASSNAIKKYIEDGEKVVAVGGDNQSITYNCGKCAQRPP